MLNGVGALHLAHHVKGGNMHAGIPIRNGGRDERVADTIPIPSTLASGDIRDTKPLFETLSPLMQIYLVAGELNLINMAKKSFLREPWPYTTEAKMRAPWYEPTTAINATWSLPPMQVGNIVDGEYIQKMHAEPCANLLVACQPEDISMHASMKISSFAENRWKDRWNVSAVYTVAVTQYHGNDSALLTSFYSFLVEQTKYNVVTLLLVRCPPASEREDAQRLVKLAGWEIEDVSTWWTLVHRWYQATTGRAKYEETAFFMMLRRAGFRAWNLAIRDVFAGGYDFRLKRIDVSRHGYIFDEGIMARYGRESRRQRAPPKKDRLARVMSRVMHPVSSVNLSLTDTPTQILDRASFMAHMEELAKFNEQEENKTRTEHLPKKLTVAPVICALSATYGKGGRSHCTQDALSYNKDAVGMMPTQQTLQNARQATANTPQTSTDCTTTTATTTTAVTSTLTEAQAVAPGVETSTGVCV